MKHLLLTTIAAVVLVGCVTKQQPKLTQILRIAALDGNIEVSKQAIAAGVDVNAKGEVEYTPLNIAAYWGHREIVELLLANGADVNVKTNWDGSTPLHFATENGHKEIVKLLIANGTDINAKKDNGKTPLDCAIEKKHTKIANFLYKNGGKTGSELLLHKAVEDKNIEVLKKHLVD